jgi:hypothetical protein
MSEREHTQCDTLPDGCRTCSLWLAMTTRLFANRAIVLNRSFAV